LADGISQAQNFTQAVDCTGIVLAKLDGTAKGGVAVAVVRDLGVPIRYVGVGEAVEDLLPFDPAAYTDALIGS
jgi:fused signal recognition particle receptor